MKLSIVFICLIFSAGVSASNHNPVNCDQDPDAPRLQSYEPNIFGFTHDDNDVNYADFKLSLMYPMFHDGVYRNPSECRRPLGFLPYPYFALTVRSAQYMKTRKSSPVVGKRFNPELFVRFWLPYDGYIDLGYGHESNGQSIDKEISFEREKQNFIKNNENPEFAKDYISRGWDYWAVNWKQSYEVNKVKFTGYLKLRYFLDNGFLQGKADEYNEWETGPVGKPRKYYDGVNVILKFNKEWQGLGVFQGIKVAFLYTTGYRDAFNNNTTRLETTFNIANMPLMFWASRGYNSDLVDYYRRVSSYGIAFELTSFFNR